MQNKDLLNYENEWILLKAEEDRLMQITTKTDREMKQKRKLCTENKQRMICLEKKMREMNLQENIEPFHISEKKKFLSKKLVEAQIEEQNILQVRPNNIVQQQRLIEVANHNKITIQNLKNQLAEFN